MFRGQKHGLILYLHIFLSFHRTALPETSSLALDHTGAASLLVFFPPWVGGNGLPPTFLSWPLESCSASVTQESATKCSAGSLFHPHFGLNRLLFRAPLDRLILPRWASPSAGGLRWRVTELPDGTTGNFISCMPYKRHLYNDSDAIHCLSRVSLLWKTVLVYRILLWLYSALCNIIHYCPRVRKIND